MSRSYRLYVQDIATAIQRIKQYAMGLDEDAFVQDQLRFDGVLFNFMTIGEAAKNIPEQVQTEHSEIDWREMARFRDLIVHHYFALNRNIVWGIIQTDLPALSRQVDALLQTLTDDD